MTGFSRHAGAHEHFAWVWELKSVNGKAFDVKLRLPQGFDRLEIESRNVITQGFKRGNVQASLSTSTEHAEDKIAVNEAVLQNYIMLAENIQQRVGAAKVSVDALMGLKGVFEFVGTEISEDEQSKRDAAMLLSLAQAVKELTIARRGEGARLRDILTAQISRIETLTFAARDNPSRSPEAIRARLKEQVARLLETGAPFDPDRLHQEAVIIATRADIQEEIDRLFGHVEAARELMVSGDPVGRKLDFLAQEFNREANTLCSKAGDKAMTNIGLELKTTIDQLREQVQNIE